MVVDVRDNLIGDVERADVAEIIARLLREDTLQQQVCFSVVNKPGPPPSEAAWSRALGLFTVPKEEALLRREF